MVQIKVEYTPKQDPILGAISSEYMLYCGQWQRVNSRVETAHKDIQSYLVSGTSHYLHEAMVQIKKKKGITIRTSPECKSVNSRGLEISLQLAMSPACLYLKARVSLILYPALESKLPNLSLDVPPLGQQWPIFDVLVATGR